MVNEINWIQYFPGLQTLDSEIQAQLNAQSLIVHLDIGQYVFAPGMAAENFLLLIKGQVRVQQISESGREIVLYRVFAGESCALTTSCLLSYEDYLAEAIVEEDVTAVAIPRTTFDYLVAHSTEFRRFVFAAFSKRITTLLHIIDEVAFSRIDIRLAHKLLELAHNNPELKRTHQQLASELGSAREVISRQMQEFQRRGWVSSSRGCITLLNVAELEKLSESS